MRVALLSLLALPSMAHAVDLSPTAALWYEGNGGQPPGEGFEEYIETTMGGTLVETANWSSITDLGDYRFVVLGRPSVDFDTAQVAALEAFMANDGILVVAGEGSTSAGVGHINTVSRLLSRIDDGTGTDFPTLDLGLTLRSTEAEAPDVNNDNIPDCVVIDTTTTSPFLGISSPLSTRSLGDALVDPTMPAAVQLASRNFLVDGVGVKHTLAARNGLVLLTSDFALFRDDACGMGSKQALWENLYELYCDRDGDNSIASECGGFDCSDLDPDEQGTFTWHDADGDGRGDPAFPSCEADAVANGDDCDDSNASVHPGAEEVCDAVDNNCTGLVDGEDPDAVGTLDYFLDGDGDGFGRSASSPLAACSSPGPGYATNDEDCADGDGAIHPDADEVCNNQVDDNCSGDVDETCEPPATLPATRPLEPGGGCQSMGARAGWGTVLLGLLGARGRRRKASP